MEDQRLERASFCKKIEKKVGTSNSNEKQNFRKLYARMVPYTIRRLSDVQSWRDTCPWALTEAHTDYDGVHIKLKIRMTLMMLCS